MSIRLFSPGDCDGDGSPEIAVPKAGLGGSFLAVFRACDGQRVFGYHELLEDLLCEPGRADWNGDGCDDLIVTRNVSAARVASDALWRDGKVEILDGRTGHVLRTFDSAILP